jgi:hypothetical protein
VGLFATFSIKTLNITLCHSAEYRVLFIALLMSCDQCCMLNGIMLNIIMLNVIMLNVIMLNVIMPNVIVLNVMMLNVIMLNVIIFHGIM